jgi:serine/threonine protein kinase
MLDTWNESQFLEEEENDEFLDYHASLTYDDLEDCGQPVRPLEFPTPVVYDGVLADLVAADHRTGIEYPLKNVLRRKDSSAQRAYLIKKKLAKSIYGAVKLAVVLERREDEEREGNNVLDKQAQWRSTGEFVAIKCSAWEKIQAFRGRHLVDPIKEISVLQLLGKGSGDNHVIGCEEVLQDDQYLYTIMPYCAGGDLYGKLEISGIQSYPDEDEARHYFKQLLSVSVYELELAMLGIYPIRRYWLVPFN